MFRLSASGSIVRTDMCLPIHQGELSWTISVDDLWREESESDVLACQRCILPVSSFQQERVEKDASSRTYEIRQRSGRPFGLAAFWSERTDAEGQIVETVRVITTRPTLLLSHYFQQLPVPLKECDQVEWLNSSPQVPLHLLTPVSADEIGGWIIEQKAATRD